MKHCPNCGYDNLDENIYCAHCGRVLGSDTPAGQERTSENPTAPSEPEACACTPGKETAPPDDMTPPPSSSYAPSYSPDAGYHPQAYYPGGYRAQVHGPGTPYAADDNRAAPYFAGRHVAEYDGIVAGRREPYQTPPGYYPPVSRYTPYPAPRKRFSAGVVVAIILCVIAVCALIAAIGMSAYRAISQYANDPVTGFHIQGSQPDTGSGKNTLPSELSAYPQVWPDDLVDHYEKYLDTPVNTMGYVVQILRDENKGCLLAGYIKGDQVYTYIVEGPTDIISDQIQVGDQLDLYGQLTDVRTFDGEEVPVFTCERADILS